MRVLSIGVAAVLVVAVAMLGACKKSAPTPHGAYRGVIIFPHAAAAAPRHVDDPARVQRLVGLLDLGAFVPTTCPSSFEEQHGTLMLVNDDGLGGTMVYVLDDGKRIELLLGAVGECRRGVPSDAKALLTELARE